MKVKLVYKMRNEENLKDNRKPSINKLNQLMLIKITK